MLRRDIVRLAGAALMRSVTGGCGIATYGVLMAPFQIAHLLASGQSLSIGFQQTPASTSQPYANLMLHDSSGTYDITQPAAGTLSLTPLTSPQRSLQSGSLQYPLNIDGETPDVSMANQLTALAIAHHYQKLVVASSCTGQGGSAMAQIQKGGTGNAYAAGIYEVQAVRNLRAGKSHGVLTIVFTHGETDAILVQGTASPDPSVYLGQLVTLQANYEADIEAITGQTGRIPMVLSQCNSSPGPLCGISAVPASQLQAALTHPDRFVMSGPKYQFANNGLYHLVDYRPLGEKSAEYMLKSLLGLDCLPLYMTSASHSGSTITVQMHIPVDFAGAPQLPLVFDTIAGIGVVHGVGTMFSMWGPGMGFEAWDNPLTVASASNASPIVVGFTAPHNLTTGAKYVVEGILGNTAANGVWTITVTGANTISLNGSTGNAAYTAGGIGFAPITITSATILGSTVTIALGRTPTSGLTVAYAEHVDQAYNTLGVGPQRSGNLRASGKFVGRSATAPLNQYCDWAVEQVISVA